MINGYDVECYRNYFTCTTIDYKTGEVRKWRVHNDVHYGESRDAFEELTLQSTMVGANSFHYDYIMMCGYLSGFNNTQLFDLSQACIKGNNLFPWNCWKEIPGLIKYEWTDIDIFGVCPLTATLKMYAGRIGFKKLQELPIDWRESISIDQHDIMDPYNENDVEATLAIYSRIGEQLKLRLQLGKQYGKRTDLLSKSDAQIAEYVIKKELKAAGIEPKKAIYDDPFFLYTPPSYLEFNTPHLQEFLEITQLTGFSLSPKGKFVLPKHTVEAIEYAGAKYKFGVGGLHSQESNQQVVVKPGWRMCEVDVASFYPNMILNEKYTPEQYGQKFLKVYGGIVEKRLAAKAAKNYSVSDSLKIVINSSFGKFGNKHSVMYSPSLLIHTTLTGQFLLLKLIEMMTEAGIEVVSANTDGIVCHYHESTSREDFDRVIAEWSQLTNLVLEETEYKALYSLSVNSYLAVKPDGSCKGKGEFGYPSYDDPKEVIELLKKNPQARIVIKAVTDYLTGGDHFVDTITNCKEISEFVYLRKGTTGVEYELHDIGNTARWYVGTKFKLPMQAIGGKGANVPNSMNAVLANELPDEWPDDVNIKYYIKEAVDMLKLVGEEV